MIASAASARGGSGASGAVSVAEEPDWDEDEDERFTGRSVGTYGGKVQREDQKREKNSTTHTDG
jgi:hypothetical protein